MNERAKRISEAIEKSGYSYPELSKITGISKSSLQRYATGETKKISIDCIEKIARATNTDSRYLMGWEEEDEDDKTITRKQLKFALFGNPDEDDDILNDVLELAKIQKMLRDNKKKERK